jgi:hypothetical protein
LAVLLSQGDFKNRVAGTDIGLADPMGLAKPLDFPNLERIEK